MEELSTVSIVANSLLSQAENHKVNHLAHNQAHRPSFFTFSRCSSNCRDGFKQINRNRKERGRFALRSDLSEGMPSSSQGSNESLPVTTAIFILKTSESVEKLVDPWERELKAA